jgi:hypothetical protein
MDKLEGSFIIIGEVTDTEEVFRPSDWANRLCEMGGTTKSRGTTHYSKHLRPIMYDGFRSVYMAAEFEEENEDAFKHVLEFALEHGLTTIER